MKELTILGVDGTGKSTLTKRINEYLNEKEYSTNLLKLPRYDTSPRPISTLGKVCDKIALLGDKKNSKELINLAYGSSLFLYRAGRKLATSPEPDVLLSERHPVIDSLAYSTIYKHKHLVKVSKLLTGFKKPEFTIYLRADSKTCLDRILNRFKEAGYDRKQEPHFHERLHYLKKLDKAYLNVLETNLDEYTIIDTTSKSKKEVFTQAVNELNTSSIV